MTNKCNICDGCGRVADDEEQLPWSIWESLPPGSSLAVKMGLVRPLPCPECKGCGTITLASPNLALLNGTERREPLCEEK